jgi:hypothetical protein
MAMDRQRAWTLATMLTVGASLFSAALSQPSFGGPAPVLCGEIDNVSICQTGECPSGEACVAVNDTCGCQPLGCCNHSVCSNGNAQAQVDCAQQAIPEFCSNTTAQECVGVFVPGGACVNDSCVEATPTATPTATATATATETATATATASATPTGTRGGDGADCADPDDCISGNCVDDVCCDTACDGPEEACNLPGNEGTCSSIAAPAPAASPTGLVLAGLALLAVAAYRFARRRSAR